MLHLSNNLREKKRKRKEILNNDLAILLSHDKIGPNEVCDTTYTTTIWSVHLFSHTHHVTISYNITL